MKKSLVSKVLLSSVFICSALLAISCGESKPSSSGGSTASSSGGTSTSGGGGSSGAVLTLNVTHNQTSLDNPYAYGIIAFKEKVEELSGGKIKVECFHGTLSENENDLVDKLENGSASMVVSSPGFMMAVGIPEVDMFSLEYLFTSFDHWQHCLDGEFGQRMSKIVNEKSGNDFRIMAYWSSAVRDYYGKKAVYKPEDLKGMKIRVQSSAVQQSFWKACGAVPTSVAWGELYQALQQGVVDGAENDYTNFMLKEHHKTKNGHFVAETHHDYTTRLLLMNGHFYDKLTDEQKKWVDEGVAYATQVHRAKVLEMAKTSKDKVIADGAEVIEHDAMDIAAFEALARPIQDEFAKKNKMEDLLQLVRNTQ